MANPVDQPFVILTAVCDASARPAAVTLGHGDAMERALNAAAGLDIAGLDLVELPIAPPAFAALRKFLQLDDQVVTAYDVFPLSGKLDARYHAIAGQFLAADMLWTLEQQGLLSGVPFSVQFETPKGWDKDPQKIHERLVQEHALDLSPIAVETFKRIKQAWEQR